MTPTQTLSGRRIMLVEDDYFIVADMARRFRRVGAEVVGPAANVEDALVLLDVTDALDGAVLDVNLGNEMAYPVADALIARGVPFVFVTGYDARYIMAGYGHIARCDKPVEPEQVAEALFAGA